jgi:hypothetical protein
MNLGSGFALCYFGEIDFSLFCCPKVHYSTVLAECMAELTLSRSIASKPTIALFV